MELGNIDYKIIIPFIYPVFYQLKKLIHKNDNKKIFEIFMIFLGYLFSGIIYLIIRYRMKVLKNKNDLNELEKEIKNDETEKEPKEKELNEIEHKIIQIFAFGQNQLDLEKKKIDKKNFRKKYLFILMLVLIYLFPLFLECYIPKIIESIHSSDSNNSSGSKDSKESNIGTSSPTSLFTCIISYIFLSRIILGEKIYMHQIFSSIIIFISILVVIIVYLINYKRENILIILINLVFIIITSSLYALFNTMEKKFYNIFMDSPYHLMFIIGLFGIIIILLYEIITLIISGIDNQFSGIFYQIYTNYKDKEYLYILIFIADILISFLFVCGIALTVYFFTPCHFIISESISQIITFIINGEFEVFSIGEIITIGIFFLVILFSGLIYNEIIIINIYSLKYNTKKYINIRQLKETQDLSLYYNITDDKTDNDN